MNALLPDAIKLFLRAEPGFRFAIETRGRESVSYWIANRQFDVGFLSQPAEDPEVQTQLLVKAPLLAVVPASHPLVKKTRIEPADLYRQPMIAVRRGTPIIEGNSTHCSGLRVSRLRYAAKRLRWSRHASSCPRE